MITNCYVDMCQNVMTQHAARHRLLMTGDVNMSVIVFFVII